MPAIYRPLPYPPQQQEGKHSPPSPPVCFRLLKIATHVQRLRFWARGRRPPLPQLTSTLSSTFQRVSRDGAHLRLSPGVGNLPFSCPDIYRSMPQVQDRRPNPISQPSAGEIALSRLAGALHNLLGSHRPTPSISRLYPDPPGSIRPTRLYLLSSSS